MSGTLQASLSGLVLLAQGSMAPAPDPRVDLLVPGLLAHQLGTLCATRNPGFLPSTEDAKGLLFAYAMHLKQEVFSSNSAEEAERLFFRAAQAARDAAREEVRPLSALPPKDANEALDRWCALTVRTFVVTTLSEHGDGHAAYMRRLGQAP